MTLPPEHAQWYARLYAAQIASWTYLVAGTVRAVGLTLVVAPFLVLFWSPVLPEGLVPPFRFGPTAVLGMIVGLLAQAVESAARRRAGRRAGQPPADLQTSVTLRTLLPNALARQALARKAAFDPRGSGTLLQGWIAAGLWLYGVVLMSVIAGALVIGVLGGRLTVG